MERCYSLKDVAKSLNVRSHRVAYALSSGAVPEPVQRLGNKRVFTADDVKRLAEHFGVRHGSAPKGFRHEG